MAFIAFFFMAGVAGAAAFFRAFFIAFMAAMVPKRVLKASCGMQSELLEPTHNHTLSLHEQDAHKKKQARRHVESLNKFHLFCRWTEQQEA